MEFRKSYILDTTDFVSYNLYFHRKRLILTPVFFFLLMSLMAFIFAFSGNTDPAAALIIFLLIVALLTGALAFWSVYSLKKQARKRYQSSLAMKTENELVIGKDGISESGECGRTAVSWPNILFAAETSSAIYVHFSRLRAFVIPKRLLSVEDDAAIRRLLAVHLPPKKLRIKHQAPSPAC